MAQHNNNNNRKAQQPALSGSWSAGMQRLEYEAALEQNVPRLLAMGFCLGFMLVVPVAVPFFASRGLDLAEVLELQALFALVVTLGEVPSGWLADRFGRRPALVLGALFMGLGHSTLLIADGFWGLVVFEVLLGVGISLVSGADVALLYDTEIHLGRSDEQRQQTLGRRFGLVACAEAAAAVTCSILVLWQLEAVAWAQALVGWAPLVLALLVVETPREQQRANVPVAAVLGHLWHSSRVLRLTVLALGLWSLTTFIAVWLLQGWWQDADIPLAWFGWLWAGLNLAAAAAGRWAPWLERRLGARLVLVLAGVAPVLGYLGLALWQHPIAGVLFALPFFLARGTGLVLLRDALNRRVPSAWRATANSLASFAFRGSYVLVGPGLGLVLSAWGLVATLWLLALASLLVLVGLMLPLALAARDALAADAAAKAAAADQAAIVAA